MAELKILFLFLIISIYKRIGQCHDLDIAPQEPEISTQTPSDNELTHVRTKNLSGNVKLTTLELLTTNSPFNNLNNVNEVEVFEGTTSENKHTEIPTIAGNGQKDVLLSSEFRTKAPTDGLEPFTLMDVFNSTSGSLPDQNSTEKLITVTPLNKLIDQDFDITRPNETATETIKGINTTPFFEDEIMEKDSEEVYANAVETTILQIFQENFATTAATIQDAVNENNKEIQNVTQYYSDLEDLTTFMKLDEEFLNTLNDQSKEMEYLNETIEDLSSILNYYEDNSRSNASVEESNGEAEKQIENETTRTIEQLNEDTEDLSLLLNSDETDSRSSSRAEEESNEENNETTTNRDLSNEYQRQTELNFEGTTTKQNFVEKSINIDENKSQTNTNFEEKTEVEITTQVEYLNEDMEHVSSIFNSDEDKFGETMERNYKDEVNYETTTTQEKRNTSLFEINSEKKNNEVTKQINFETTTKLHLSEEIETISTIHSSDEENSKSTVVEDKAIIYETTTTYKDLNEKYETKTAINLDTTTTMKQETEKTTFNSVEDKFISNANGKEEINKEHDHIVNYEETTTRVDPEQNNSKFITNSPNSEEEEYKEYEERMIYEATTIYKALNEEHESKIAVNSNTTTIKQDVETTTLISQDHKSTSNNKEEINEEYKDRMDLETTTTKQISFEKSVINYDEDISQIVEEKNSEEYQFEKENNFETTITDLNNNVAKNEEEQHYEQNTQTKLETVSTQKREDLIETTEKGTFIIETGYNHITTNSYQFSEIISAFTEESKINEIEEKTSIFTRNTEKTTISSVFTTEKPEFYSEIYEKTEIEREVLRNDETLKNEIEDELAELEKIEEDIINKENEIMGTENRDENSNVMNNEITSRSYNNLEDTTILCLSKQEGYNQIVTSNPDTINLVTETSNKIQFNLSAAEMLKTETEKVQEPQILINISGRSQQFSIKIIYNESIFFVPSDAFILFQSPNILNITWKASDGRMNNSIELNFGNSLQLRLVKDNQMYVHKTALISESEDKLDDTNLITLEDGVQIYFSNIDFLKTDKDGNKNEPENSKRNNPVKALAGEIIGSCIGVCILTGIVVYFLAKKFRGKSRNFKPNGEV